MRSGEEIRQALVTFAKRWRDFGGGEAQEAQTFLNELFACYGRDRKDAGAVFEDARTTSGIMDLHLPGVAIIEMKSPKEAGNLDRHREQALTYWRHSPDVKAERPAPRYVVLCAFHRFEIWEPGFPACGCGNFLYVAYRKLRTLEQSLKEKISRLSQASGIPAPTGLLYYYPVGNLHGIDVVGFATRSRRSPPCGWGNAR